MGHDDRDPASQAEDESIRRFARFEWLARQIEQAAREADAHFRLDRALDRAGAPGLVGTPRHHLRAA